MAEDGSNEQDPTNVLPVAPSPDNTPQSVAPSADSLQSVAPSAISSSTGDMNNRPKNKRQRVMEAQSEGTEKIFAALLTFFENAEDRAQRADDAKLRRYEVMVLRSEEEHRRKKEEHVWNVASMQTTLVKDFKYVIDELKDAYRQLELIDPASVMTPQEKFHYSVTKEWVEILESRRAGLKRMLIPAYVESLDPSSAPSLQGLMTNTRM